LDDLPNVRFDAVVTMGCGDACPNVEARVHEDWSIPDPKAMSPDEFDAVRDVIASKVVKLLEALAASSGGARART
jgi:protein-tyrosine-phosphatase